MSSVLQAIDNLIHFHALAMVWIDEAGDDPPIPSDNECRRNREKSSAVLLIRFEIDAVGQQEFADVISKPYDEIQRQGIAVVAIR